MSSRTAGVGLRDEAGSNSANSRVKRAAVSSTLPDYFGNEENHEARASTHPNLARGLPSFGRCPQAPPVAVSAASSRNSGSGGRNSGTCRSGSDRRSPAAAATVTPTSKHAVFAGGRKVPVGKPRRASSKASLTGTAPVGPAAAGGGNRTARPRPRRQPPPPPSQSPRSVSMDSDKMSAACWSKDGGGCAAVGDGGASFSRAASRVALRAARAKGLTVTLPAALFVPSRLMDSTAASRAGVYTPPNGGKDESASAAATSVAAAMVTPRRLAPPRRRRSLGVVAGVSEGGDAISTAAAAAAAAASTAVSASAGAREVAESYDIASTGSCGSGSSGRKRELQERTGFMHLSDEVPPRSLSGNNTFVPTISSAVGVPKRGRSAGAALVLPPPTRCHDDLSTELEAQAMRRSIGRSNSNSSISSVNSVAGVSRGGNGDDGRLWKPSKSFREGIRRSEKFPDDAADGEGKGESFSAGGSAASFWSPKALNSRGGVEAAMDSSLDSSWSMSSVDETARQPNARETHASGGDPVARMLLCQSDDYDYGFDFGGNSSRGSNSSGASGTNSSSGSGGGGDQNSSGGVGRVFGPSSLATFARSQVGSSSLLSSTSSFSSSSMTGTGGGLVDGLPPPGPEAPSLAGNPAAATAAVAGGRGGRGGACGSGEWGVSGRSSPTLFAAAIAGGAAVKVSWVKREGGRGFGECRSGGVFSSVLREGFGDANGPEKCLFRPFAFHRPS